MATYESEVKLIIDKTQIDDTLEALEKLEVVILRLKVLGFVIESTGPVNTTKQGVK